MEMEMEMEKKMEMEINHGGENGKIDLSLVACPLRCLSWEMDYIIRGYTGIYRVTESESYDTLYKNRRAHDPTEHFTR